jgi:hypothetical protein
MLIFGFGAGAPKDQGPALPLRCPNCSNEVDYHYVVQRSWFRLFFIPVIPYATKHLLVCPVCSRGIKLEKAQAGAAAALVDATARRRAGALDPESHQRQVAALLAGLGAAAPGPRPAPGAPQPAPQPAPAPALAPGPGGALEPSTPAGWFPDPYGQAEQRYWDGQRWTGGTIPPSA